MYKHSLVLLAFTFSATGCRIDTLKCDHDDDVWDDDGHCCAHDGHDHAGGGVSGGTSDGSGGGAGSGGAASGGATTGSGGASAGGASASGAGGASAGGTAGSAAMPMPMPCNDERDCAKGYNCDPSLHECTPSDAETCGELTTEPVCTDRADCLSVYAGIDCTCGPDCQCVGGEPGCTCAHFEFFKCVPAE